MVTTQELAKYLYMTWARRQDSINPMWDEFEERTRPRRKWDSLETAQQFAWIEVAETATRISSGE